MFLCIYWFGPIFSSNDVTFSNPSIKLSLFAFKLLNNSHWLIVCGTANLRLRFTVFPLNIFGY